MEEQQRLDITKKNMEEQQRLDITKKNMEEQQRRGESKAQQGTNKRLFKVFVADIEWYR
jgi:hypothetical protein